MCRLPTVTTTALRIRFSCICTGCICTASNGIHSPGKAASMLFSVVCTSPVSSSSARTLPSSVPRASATSHNSRSSPSLTTATSNLTVTGLTVAPPSSSSAPRCHTRAPPEASRRRHEARAVPLVDAAEVRLVLARGGGPRRVEARRRCRLEAQRHDVLVGIGEVQEQPRFAKHAAVLVLVILAAPEEGEQVRIEQRPRARQLF
eukprot:scaffold95684_cov69-Phaeocystis_antarctica.AAC.1